MECLFDEVEEVVNKSLKLKISNRCFEASIFVFAREFDNVYNFC